MASPASRLWSPTISDNRAVRSLMKASPSQGCAAMYFIAALTDLPPEATKGVLIDAQLVSPSGMVAEDPPMIRPEHLAAMLDLRPLCFIRVCRGDPSR